MGLPSMLGGQSRAAQRLVAQAAHAALPAAPLAAVVQRLIGSLSDALSRQLPPSSATTLNSTAGPSPGAPGHFTAAFAGHIPPSARLSTHATFLHTSLPSPAVPVGLLRAAAAPLALPPVMARPLPNPLYQALLVDAAGTLIYPSEPAARVYQRYAAKYGCTLSEGEILARYRRAYNAPFRHWRIRFEGDARPFWRHIIAQSTGVEASAQLERLLEEVYDYYERPEAWRIADGAVDALRSLRAAGVRTGIVSNFDTRLRPLLGSLGLLPLLSCVIVSAEHGFEKPNPCIFEAALNALGVEPHQVGDLFFSPALLAQI